LVWHPVVGRGARALSFSPSWVGLGPGLASHRGARGSRPSFFAVPGAGAWFGIPLQGTELAPIIFRSTGVRLGIGLPSRGGVRGSCPLFFRFRELVWLPVAGRWPRALRFGLSGVPLRGAELAPLVCRSPGVRLGIGLASHGGPHGARAPLFSLVWSGQGPGLACHCGAQGLAPFVFCCPGWSWGLVWRPFAGRGARAPRFSFLG